MAIDRAASPVLEGDPSSAVAVGVRVALAVVPGDCVPSSPPPKNSTTITARTMAAATAMPART
jgi:hypothetical protein